MVTARRLEPGAVVVSGDGKRLGTVKEVAEDRFKLDRRLQPDIWLALEYVDHVSAGLVQMIVTKDVLGAARVESPRA
jgi:hypothetical protein